MTKADSANPIYDSVRSRRNIITLAEATKTLDAKDSGSLYLLDKATGIVVTLPLAKPGLVFEFAVPTSVTSNAYKIITGAGTELLTGRVISEDTDSSDALIGFPGNGSTHVAISMNGTTTGGLKGSQYKFTCLSSTLWMVEGVNHGSGTVATPFATS